MTGHLAACTLVALAAVIATMVLRGQPAAWRHAILFLALLRFAVPTAWLAHTGRMLSQMAPGHAPLVGAAGEVVRLLQTPGAEFVTPVGADRPDRKWFVAVVWPSGMVACLALWAWRARRRIPAARPASEQEIAIFRRASGGRNVELRIVAADIVPGAWGWWRPCVILPDGLSLRLEEAELESVLAHEVAHVGRRDNLVAALAHAVVSVFWFHPLVWWIEHRMLAERETACDEFVLARGMRAEDYVAGISKVCCIAFAGPTPYAGITGSNLKNRMEFIMSLNPYRRSSRAVRALLGMLLALVVGLPVASGYLSAQQNTPMAPQAASAAEARFQEGVRLLGEKHYAEAEQAFREVQQMEPTGTRGLLGQVEAKIDQGQVDEPLKLLQAEIDREPSRVDLRTAFGKAAVRLGRYDQAITQFQDVLGKTDQDSQAAGNLYLSIGETYRRKGDTESAIANLRRAAEILQESPIARNTLALALDSAGNKEEAQREYRAALAGDANNAVALNNLAYRLAEDGGSLDEALALVQRARKLQPDLNEISDTLGWIYLKMGKAKDAVPVFADLVQKRLQNPTFHFHLAMALLQTGDKFAAVEQLQTALQFHPPEELAQRIRELLATIQH